MRRGLLEHAAQRLERIENKKVNANIVKVNGVEISIVPIRLGWTVLLYESGPGGKILSHAPVILQDIYICLKVYSLYFLSERPKL